YASDATTVAGAWQLTKDSSAAGGIKLLNPDAAMAKLTAPLASPASYFDVAFVATAGIPYRLWIRGNATKDSYNNDSVYVQFSGAVNASAAPVYRIGTTSGVAISIEDC